MSQLKELLGLPSNQLSHLSDDEYEFLVKRFISENVHTSANTLLSLSKLIDSLPNMVVLDNIRSLVELSVDSLNKVNSQLQYFIYKCSLFVWLIVGTFGTGGTQLHI